MHVLILAHDFPPLNTVGARRPLSWYNYFPKYDIHPVVITKSWEDSSSTIHEIAMQKGLRETVIEEHADRTLIRVPLSNSLPEKLLRRYGASRFILLRKALSFLYLILAYPLFQFDKNVRIFKEARSYLKQHHVDFIIATAEPFILFKHAHLLSKKFKVPWIADFRDGWILNHVTSQRKGFAIRLLRSWEFIFEKNYLSSCKFMTAVAPIMAEKLSALHNKKAYVIYNGFEDFLPAIPNKNERDLPLVLCHAGTLYPGQKAEILLQAIHDLDTEGKISPAELKIQFLGIDFYPEQRKRVMQFSSTVTKYLQTTKRIPLQEARQINAEADFLIVFAEQHQSVFPAKTYDYISTRSPLLSILNDHAIPVK